MQAIKNYNWSNDLTTNLDEEWTTSMAQQVLKEGYILTTNTKQSLTSQLEELHRTTVQGSHTFEMTTTARNYLEWAAHGGSHYDDVWMKWIYFLCRDTPTHVPLEALHGEHSWINHMDYVHGPELQDLLNIDQHYMWIMLPTDDYERWMITRSYPGTTAARSTATATTTGHPRMQCTTGSTWGKAIMGWAPRRTTSSSVSTLTSCGNYRSSIATTRG